MATGLDGGEIQDIVSADSVLIAITKERGIYRKVDTNAWQLIHANLRYENLVNVDSCIIAYQNYFDNPIVSFDYGETWEENELFANSSIILSIDSVLFFGQLSNLRSFDCGETYDTILFPLPFENHSLSVLTDDSLLYLHAHNIITEDNYLYYSDDYGQNWNSLPTTGLFTAPYINILQIKYINGTYWAFLDWMHTGYTPREIYYYASNNQWVSATNNLPYASYNDMIEFNEKLLISVGDFPVFEFDYEESLWIPFANASKTINKFVYHENDLFCATDQGVNSLDTSGNWYSFNDGLNHREITSIDLIDDKIYIAASNEIYYSEDNGTSFTILDGAFGHQIITTDSVFYTISRHDYRMSWDNGISWHSYSNNLEDNFKQGLINLSITPYYYYMGTGRGLFRTSPYPINWSKVENGPFNSDFRVNRVESITHSIFVTEYFYSQKTYYSLNNGYSYNIFGNFMHLSKIDQTYYLISSDSIHYSNTPGFDWEGIKIWPNGNEYYFNCIDRKGDIIVIAGSTIYDHLAIRMSYYEGDYFFDIMDNLPNHPYHFESINTIKISDGRILIGNPKDGLWYRDDILTGAFENQTSNLSDDTFVNVYPNPIVTSTTFEYTLQQPSSVKITIYNHLGKQVNLIQKQQSSGLQKVTWYATGQPSGVYYYRMQARDHGTSGKILLMR